MTEAGGAQQTNGSSPPVVTHTRIEVAAQPSAGAAVRAAPIWPVDYACKRAVHSFFMYSARFFSIRRTCKRPDACVVQSSL